ncbi:type III secretion protein [Pseudomonas fluorescens]|nr:type III secretion protein [Pseudomonas fluorescens]NLT86375.1 type III secretion protein [Pseudomonas lactis]RZI20883.1 type III secretion protein [Pseudomonas sp. 770NI]NKI53719.1 type III secretion protein [Pseudomonas fluorescens]NKI64300.1 type III secretion protein [Pseudomonas fluorescens]
MAPRPDPLMREQLAWAQWWAFPWKQAHEDWRGEEYRAIERLFYNGRSVPDNLTGFKACLPAAPHATVLRLALATTDQLNLGLALVTHIFNPEAPSPLSESHHQWCMRLSMALHPSMLPPHSDPLRLLHSWVEPAIWQRLRLRFPRTRVSEAEIANAPLEHASGRLNTLWQAVVWRVTTMASGNTSLSRTGEENSNVMPTYY